MSKSLERSKADVGLLYFAIGITTIATLSFAFAAIENPLRQDRYSPMVISHAALMTAWLLLFVVQASFIRIRRTATHKKLGKLSGLLVVAMVLNSIPVALNFHDDFGRDMTLYGDFALMVAFVLLYALAVFNAINGRFENHKRYILVASLVLISPAYARAVDVFDGSRALAAALALLSIVLVPLAYDLTISKRPQWVTVRAIALSVFIVLFALATASKLS